ncbi:hypothetical protein V1281_001429 [Nitrobacteraceae bacterium AZCC 2161]
MDTAPRRTYLATPAAPWARSGCDFSDMPMSSGFRLRVGTFLLKFLKFIVGHETAWRRFRRPSSSGEKRCFGSFLGVLIFPSSFEDNLINTKTVPTSLTRSAAGPRILFHRQIVLTRKGQRVRRRVDAASHCGPFHFLRRAPIAQCAMKPHKGSSSRTHPTSAVLSDAGYFAKRVALSLALRSSGDAGRGFRRVGAAAALVAG